MYHFPRATHARAPLATQVRVAVERRIAAQCGQSQQHAHCRHAHAGHVKRPHPPSSIQPQVNPRGPHGLRVRPSPGIGRGPSPATRWRPGSPLRSERCPGWVWPAAPGCPTRPLRSAPDTRSRAGRSRSRRRWRSGSRGDTPVHVLRSEQREGTSRQAGPAFSSVAGWARVDGWVLRVGLRDRYRSGYTSPPGCCWLAAATVYDTAIELALCSRYRKTRAGIP
jgi:hypothetical protein